MAQDERLGASPKGRSKGGLIFLLLLLVIAAVAGWFYCETEPPTLELGRELAAVGARVDLPVKAADGKSGLSLISVRLKQGEQDKELFVKRFARKSWFTRQAGPAEFAETVAIGAGDEGFADGPAELAVTVRDQSLMGFFKGNSTEIRRQVMVDTQPPAVQLKGNQWSIQPGGSAAVGYTVSEEPARHGVRIGETFFPGAPGRTKGSYVCLFALPWNAEAAGPTALVVQDAAGNEAKVEFNVTFKPWRPKQDTIKLSDGFFERKMPEFKQHYPEMQGSLLDQYLFVNREVRRRNAAQVAEICAKSDPEQLWKGRFLRMKGAGRAGFADQRSYMYQGNKVDEQNHLGVDIASVVQAEVRAANRGKVAFAGFIGIYGNVVILDHGQGLASLYAHLSSIDPAAKPGAVIEADQLIGRTGISGMAGGDHLHFSMLVRGVFVTPVEWWDQHWIDVNIEPHLQ